jgi:DUF1680 family protein
MSQLSNRREFMKRAVAGASLVPHIVSSAETKSGSQIPERDSGARIFLEPFNYSGVRLLDGMLKTQYQATRDFYYSIPDDDILRGFRQRAGQAAPGTDLGGWYSDMEPPCWPLWYGAHGHSFGQWLSGMARMYRATGDVAILEKAKHLMLEWGKTIAPDGFFFYVLGPGEEMPPRRAHYTYEKMVYGLVDMFEHAGEKDALPLLEKITDWAIENLVRTRRPFIVGEMPAESSGIEWYTLCENLYRAYQLTGNAKYKTFGDLWRYHHFWGMFSSQVPLKPAGLHASGHVNSLNSAAMTYAVTGDSQYLTTIINAYDYLQQTQCYATGGYGPGELFQAPDGSLGRSLETTTESFETVCGSWHAFRLSRYLMQFTGEARYGDWIEKLVYNGIGAALPMAEGGKTFYYSDYILGGARKVYVSETHHQWTWPCCSGTYPQAVADYHNIIYFRDPTSLYVNLFIPSEVTWNYEGNQVQVLQETTYPKSDTTTLTVHPPRSIPFNLKFRVPGWSRGATVQVNGSMVDVGCQPGTWAAITRTWRPGDRVAIRIPMQLSLSSIDKQRPHRVALTYGPVVLVQDQQPTLLSTKAELSQWLVREGEPLLFRATGLRAGIFRPFYDVGYRAAYGMYFDVKA